MSEDTLKGLFWLIFPVILLWFDGTRTFGLYMLGFYAICIAGVILWAQNSNRKEAEAAEIRQAQIIEAKAKISEIVGEHLETLARRRKILVRVDHYGVVDGAAWNKEVQHFVDSVIAPRLNEQQVAVIKSVGMNAVFGELIEEVVGGYCDSMKSSDLSVDNHNPLEFEALCCLILQESGWNASTTKGSGDQGADIVADRDGKRLVVQCKLYGGTVGNKAVQEIFAAKAFYGSQIAAVVCKNGYTKSAKQLASASNVALLDVTELKEYAKSPY